MILSLQFKYVLAGCPLALLLGSVLVVFAQDQPETTGSGGGASGNSPMDQHLPDVRIVNGFAPPGESNVRSSIRLQNDIALIGTEESGDIYKSEDAGNTWTEWIELARDDSGGASNLEQINACTLIVGVGNHSAQGHVYTLEVH